MLYLNSKLINKYINILNKQMNYISNNDIDIDILKLKQN
jgi:hypothetical protein